MRVDRATQVGRDPFAKPGHHVKARRGGYAQYTGDAEQGQEIQVDMIGALDAAGAEAQIDHLPECVRNRQGGAGRYQQGQAGHHKLPFIRGQEGN